MLNKFGLKTTVFLTIQWFIFYILSIGVVFFLLKFKSSENISFESLLNDPLFYEAFVISCIGVIGLLFSPKFKPDDPEFWFRILWRTTGVGFLTLSPLFFLLHIKYTNIIFCILGIGLVVTYIIYCIINSKLKKLSLMSICIASLCLIDVILLMIHILLYDFKSQRFYVSVNLTNIITFYLKLPFSFFPLALYACRKKVTMSFNKNETVRIYKISDEFIRKFIIYICFAISIIYICFHSFCIYFDIPPYLVGIPPSFIDIFYLIIGLSLILKTE